MGAPSGQSSTGIGGLFPGFNTVMNTANTAMNTTQSAGQQAALPAMPSPQASVNPSAGLPQAPAVQQHNFSGMFSPPPPPQAPSAAGGKGGANPTEPVVTQYIPPQYAPPSTPAVSTPTPREVEAQRVASISAMFNGIDSH